MPSPSVSSGSIHSAAPESPLAETSPTPTVTVTAAPFETRAGGGVADELRRPQAGPLPKKRGELGYQEGSDSDADADTTSQASSSSTTLPVRHPADRDASATTEASASTTEPPRSPSRAESTRSTRTANSTGKRSLISFLRPKRIPTVGGLLLTTLALFLLQLALLSGTIAGWVLIVKRMQKSTPAPNPPPSGSDQDSSSGVFSSTSAQIFVHVAFGIVSLAELIFLERSVFRLRAERYAHVHPGEILPRTRRAAHEGPAAAGVGINIALAPWNRPPLPTYAAALAQSGVGTGDVEDNAIAIPPPPAYGNTRGSTLLLLGFLTDTLRMQRPRSNGSARSRISGRSRRSAEQGEEPGDRPKSYMSTDPEWEELCDADRALILEETLARLEEGSPESRRS